MSCLSLKYIFNQVMYLMNFGIIIMSLRVLHLQVVFDGVIM
jgi:hypothetical protein